MARKAQTRARSWWRDLFKAQRWDAARTNPADRGVWARADLLAIDTALNAQTRAAIRRRARYVVANNAYAAGAAQALVNATVGAAPRLQLTSARLDSETLTEIEADFTEWAEAVSLPEKLRALRFARFVDGEAFAVMYSNDRLTTSSGVTLDLRPLDCDRVAGALADANPDQVDGITLDRYGDPVAYRILDQHPGALGGVDIGAAREYPAGVVCHWFKKLYPEQHRGISELAPCLELFNLIDRYSKAVVQASETAADLAMVFTTDAVADAAYDVTEPPAPATGQPPFVQIPWARGMTMTVPEGWQAKQITAEQPSNSYGMLVDEVLSQIGAAISVPKLLMKNSAENYNYSSARVDLQQFQIAVKLDRQSMTHAVLYPLWRAWFAEYRLAKQVTETPRAVWYYDGFFHVDPLKEANAAAVRLSTNTSSLAAEYGARGMDWEQELREIAREKAVIKQLEEEFGVSMATPATVASTGGGGDSDDRNRNDR